MISAVAQNGISEVMTGKKIISRTHSPYNSAVWPVGKADRRWYLTIDYWYLRANTARLTAAVTNIANLTATFQAAALPLMVVLDIKKKYVLYGSLEGGG